MEEAGAELVVNIVHVDQPHAQPLSRAMAFGACLGHQAGVGDDDVVGAVGVGGEVGRFVDGH